MAVTTTKPDAQEVARGVAQIAAAIPTAMLGERMADALLAAIPEFSGTPDADFRAGMIASCTANLAAVQQQLMSGAPSYDITAPAGAIALGRDIVHRGLPLAALLRAYRLGHGLFERSWEQLSAERQLEPEVRWHMLVEASRYVFVYIDTVCTQLTRDYEAEREQWVRGAEAARVALARRIVAGQPVDDEKASAALRYNVDRPHLGLVVWHDASAGEGDHSSALAAAARALAGEVGGGPTLVVATGDHCVWAWTAAEHVVAKLPSRSAALGDGVHAALGSVQAGVEGMCRSHHEARAARRVGELFGHRPGSLMRFHAVALASLLSADPVQALRFAESELGRLSASSDLNARLRATLRVFLEERLSPARTSRRLGIHQNTVVYRVKQAEELLGRPVDARRLELEVALRLSDGLDGLRAAAAAQRAEAVAQRP